MKDKEYLINRFIRKSEEASDTVNLLSKTILSTNQKIDETNFNLDKTNNYISDIFDNIETLNNNKINSIDKRLSDARKPLPHKHTINDISNLQSIIAELQNNIEANKKYTDNKLLNIKKESFEPVVEEKVKELYKSVASLNQRLGGVTNILSEQASLINEYKDKPTQIIENKPIIQQIDLSEIQDLYLQIEKLNQKIKDLSNGKIDFKKIEDKLFDKLSKSVKTTQQVTFVTRNGIQNLSQLKDVNIDTPTNGQTLIYNSTTEQWENGTGGGGGAVDSVNGQTGAVVLASDPNLTITGDGLPGTEFKYNEVVVVVTSSTVFLDDTMIYYTFTTDGSTNFDFDYTAITLPDFTFKVFVNQRSPAQITIPVFNDIWIGDYQYVVSIRTAQRGASATVRFKSNRINITNLCGNWEGI